MCLHVLASAVMEAGGSIWWWGGPHRDRQRVTYTWLLRGLGVREEVPRRPPPAGKVMAPQPQLLKFITVIQHFCTLRGTLPPLPPLW